MSASKKLDVVAARAITESAKAEPMATSEETSKQQLAEEAEVSKIEAEVADAEANEVMDELAAGAKLEGTAAELELQAGNMTARVKDQGELSSCLLTMSRAETSSQLLLTSRPQPTRLRRLRT